MQEIRKTSWSRIINAHQNVTIHPPSVKGGVFRLESGHHPPVIGTGLDQRSNPVHLAGLEMNRTIGGIHHHLRVTEALDGTGVNMFISTFDQPW